MQIEKKILIVFLISEILLGHFLKMKSKFFYRVTYTYMH